MACVLVAGGRQCIIQGKIHSALCSICPFIRLSVWLMQVLNSEKKNSWSQKLMRNLRLSHANGAAVSRPNSYSHQVCSIDPVSHYHTKQKKNKKLRKRLKIRSLTHLLTVANGPHDSASRRTRCKSRAGRSKINCPRSNWVDNTCDDRRVAATKHLSTAYCDGGIKQLMNEHNDSSKHYFSIRKFYIGGLRSFPTGHGLRCLRHCAWNYESVFACDRWAFSVLSLAALRGLNFTQVYMLRAMHAFLHKWRLETFDSRTVHPIYMIIL